jgi:TPR repeat protein
MSRLFCHFQDIIKAYSYFLIAARLSDLDAQLALASCYLHGVGCPNGKKDRHAAAYWYRRAIEQGASSNGLGWVYKKKYASYQGA